MDVDKTLAWKQSLLFIGGIITVFIGLFFIPFLWWLGIIINLAGFAMLIINLRSVIYSKQEKSVKIALIIPKAIFLTILVMLSIGFYLANFVL